MVACRPGATAIAVGEEDGYRETSRSAAHAATSKQRATQTQTSGWVDAQHTHAYMDTYKVPATKAASGLLYQLKVSSQGLTTLCQSSMQLCKKCTRQDFPLLAAQHVRSKQTLRETSKSTPAWTVLSDTKTHQMQSAVGLSPWTANRRRRQVMTAFKPQFLRTALYSALIHFGCHRTHQWWRTRVIGLPAG
jgi:hypothetical protein